MDISGKGIKISIIEAAGGAIVSRRGFVLMMLRRGMWDLPKGHLDPGETLRECATREVCEECGLDPAHLTVHERIAETVHMSKPDEKKHTTWFRMTYSGDEADISPQTEEDITVLEWVTPDEARRRAIASYKTIQEVIERLIQTIL